MYSPNGPMDDGTGIWTHGNADENGNPLYCSTKATYVPPTPPDLEWDQYPSITVTNADDITLIVPGMIVWGLGFDFEGISVVSRNNNTIVVSSIPSVQPSGFLTFVDPAGTCQEVRRTSGCDLCGNWSYYDYSADPCRQNDGVDGPDGIPDIECVDSEFRADNKVCFNYPADHPSGIPDIGGYVRCSINQCGNTEYLKLQEAGYTATGVIEESTSPPHYFYMITNSQENCTGCDPTDPNTFCGVWLGD